MAEKQDSSPQACARFEEDLILYHYQELGDAERERMETHLEDCAACRLFIEELRRLLPQTIVADDPPAAFWQSYSNDIHKKLRAAENTAGWREAFLSLFHSWPLPIVATASIVALAVTLTLTRGQWWSRETPPPELGEMFSVTENLEFFKSMDFFDSIDLLEAMEGQEAPKSETPYRAL
ncbi:MAG: anti-sigma factor family protein [Candidatus Omnitrophota bacterium]